VFAIIYIFVMSWTGRGSAGRVVDPYADWASQETTHAVLHFRESAPEETRSEIGRACERAGRRAEVLLGDASWERIDFYLYPSLDEKLRVTGNGAIAHSVEWANAVHLAWVDGAEPALTREVFKLAGAQVFGKVYNPLVRDGLAVYAGVEWAGEPLLGVAGDLEERNVLPRLERLVDPAAFAATDFRLAEPAAGSFVAFVIDEVGPTVLRDVYSASAQRPHSLGAVLEEALSDSLAGIERRWISYLEERTGAQRTEPRPDR
jgi:hypothetical protein